MRVGGRMTAARGDFAFPPPQLLLTRLLSFSMHMLASTRGFRDRFRKDLASADRSRRYYATIPEEHEGSVPPSGQDNMRHNIVFDHVSFTYPDGNDRPEEIGFFSRQRTDV